MGDLLFQIFLALLGIVIGILSQLARRRAQRWMLLIFGLLLFLFGGLSLGFRLATQELAPPPTIISSTSTVATITSTPSDTPIPSSPVPGAASTNPSNQITLLAIEQFPGVVVSYAGSENNMGGTATLTKLIRGSAHVYILSYELPPDKEGYAGFVFNFDHGEDISQYQKIEFSIEFQTQGEQIDLHLRDIAGIKDSVRVASTGIEPMNLSIELEAFAGVNLNAIKEVIFDVNTTFESGPQEIIISDVRFVP
jgi:hypothetical protein